MAAAFPSRFVVRNPSERPCAARTRATYAPPVLERPGALRALTLQQSVPILP